MAKKASGGIKGKGKKNGGGAMSGGGAGGGGHSQHHGGKLKKGSQFKSLHKQRTTTAVVEMKRKPDGRKQTAVTRKPLHVSDEVRSFNERVAGEKKRSEARRQQITAAKNLSIAPPTFVIAAPTFSFGAPPPAPVKEVEGFQGFISTMTAPKDAPQARPDPETRRVKPIQPTYQSSNVFAVLEVEEEQEQEEQHQYKLQHQHMLQQQKLVAISQQQAQQRSAAMAAAAQLPSPFLQPATFSFQSASPAFQFQPAAVTTSSSSVLSDIDPDL